MDTSCFRLNQPNSLSLAQMPTTAPDDFDKVSENIENKNIDIDGEVSLIASNIVKVSKEQSDKILTLLDLLDNHDDIQKVHTNFEIE